MDTRNGTGAEGPVDAGLVCAICGMASVPGAVHLVGDGTIACGELTKAATTPFPIICRVQPEPALAPAGHPLTDAIIAAGWPEMDSEAGRAEIRRQFDLLLAASRPQDAPASIAEPEAVRQARAIARAPWCYSSAVITAALVDVVKLLDDTTAEARRIADLADLRCSQELYLEEVADGAWGDNPAVRGAARDRLADFREREHEAEWRRRTGA